MATVEEIKSHLNHILDKVAKAQNIENYEINVNTEAKIGDGFVSQFFEGSIRNKITGKTLDIAIKRAPQHDFQNHLMFFNEYLFYENSYPALDDLQNATKAPKPFASIPKYYCGELETKKEYLVMENLKKLGYVMFDKTQFLDEQHLETIFKTYGKFHALSFVLRNKDLEKYERITKDYHNVMPSIVTMMAKPITAAISAAVNALDPEKDKTVYEELYDFGNHTMELFEQSLDYKGKYRCLVHGDCWSNNMLFRYSESGKLLNIKLIDFQVSRDHTPINDLSYFFYSGASKKDFDKLDYYLEVYHESFSEFVKELGGNPEELFPLEALRTDWKEYGIFGIIFGIYLWQAKLTPKEKFTEIIADKDYENRSMEDNLVRLDMVVKEIFHSEVYRERATNILRHAFEYGIVSKKRILENKGQ